MDGVGRHNAASLEPEGKARTKLKVVSLLRLSGDEGRIHKDRRYTPLSVMNERVTCFQAERPTARAIKLQHASKVTSEKGSPSSFENSASECESAERKRFSADEIQRAAEADESRARLTKESEPLKSLAGFDAKLALGNASRSAGGNAVRSWKVVNNGLEREKVCEIESEPTPQSSFGLGAILAEKYRKARQLAR